MAWNSVPQDKLDDWRKAFAQCDEVVNPEAACPVCNQQTLHRYYHLHRSESNVNPGFVGRGGLWEWCSSCLSFEHYSSRVPDWWSCPFLVDEANLYAIPETIEAARAAHERDADRQVGGRENENVGDPPMG